MILGQVAQKNRLEKSKFAQSKTRRCPWHVKPGNTYVQRFKYQQNQGRHVRTSQQLTQQKSYARQLDDKPIKRPLPGFDFASLLFFQVNFLSNLAWNRNAWSLQLFPEIDDDGLLNHCQISNQISRWTLVFVHCFQPAASLIDLHMLDRIACPWRPDLILVTFQGLSCRPAAALLLNLKADKARPIINRLINLNLSGNIFYRFFTLDTCWMIIDIISISSKKMLMASNPVKKLRSMREHNRSILGRKWSPLLPDCARQKGQYQARATAKFVVDFSLPNLGFISKHGGVPAWNRTGPEPNTAELSGRPSRNRKVNRGNV